MWGIVAMFEKQKVRDWENRILENLKFIPILFVVLVILLSLKSKISLILIILLKFGCYLDQMKKYREFNEVDLNLFHDITQKQV